MSNFRKLLNAKTMRHSVRDLVNQKLCGYALKIQNFDVHQIKCAPEFH